MKELNPLEKELESWTPRHPSPEIAKRLFGSRESKTEPRAQMPAWAWLAPAMCLFLVLVLPGVTRTQARMENDDTNASNMLASITRYSEADDTRCQEWNIWRAVSFDWTKGGASQTSTGSIPLLNTNIHRF